MNNTQTTAETIGWVVIYLLIVGPFWAATLTRTLYPNGPIMSGSSSPVQGVIFAVLATMLLTARYWWWGVMFSLLLIGFSAWFAWSSRVPLVFRAWSYHRLTGDAMYTITDPPPTVWQRPRWVRSWWPEWL